MAMTNVMYMKLKYLPTGYTTT